MEVYRALFVEAVAHAQEWGEVPYPPFRNAFGVVDQVDAFAHRRHQRDACVDVVFRVYFLIAYAQILAHEIVAEAV